MNTTLGSAGITTLEEDDKFGRYLLDGILDKGWSLPTVLKKLHERDFARGHITHIVVQNLSPGDSARRTIALTLVLLDILSHCEPAGRQVSFSGEQLAEWRRVMTEHGVQMAPQQTVA